MSNSGLKSMAHPGWPYAGTAHEWRGFVKKEGADKPSFEAVDRPASEFFQMLYGGPDMPNPACGVPDFSIYQKQNFGPELK